MSPLESQEDLDRRLFDRWHYPFWEWVSQVVPDVEQEDQRLVYWAIMLGGSLASVTAVQNCSCLVKAWGNGDELKAQAVTLVFALAMASRWLRNIDSQIERPPEVRGADRETLASTLLTAFNSYSGAAVQGFLNMDMQFNIATDKEESQTYSILERNLLAAEAVEACGQTSGLRWTDLSFPVESQGTLLDSGLRIEYSPDDDVAMMTALVAGLKVMNDTYTNRAFPQFK